MPPEAASSFSVIISYKLISYMNKHMGGRHFCIDTAEKTSGNSVNLNKGHNKFPYP